MVRYRTLKKPASITYPRANGSMIDLHRDRGGAKAVVVFYRTAVW